MSLWLWVLYASLVAGVAGLSVWLHRYFDTRSLLLFSIIPVLFLAPGFFRDQSPVPTDHLRAFCPPWQVPGAPEPHNATLSDVVSQFAPWAKAVRLSWKSHSPPFLNQWNGCGMPLAANGSSSAFSPFTIPMFLLPLANAFVLLGAAKLFLALTGMYQWLRELDLSQQAARFGAVTFGLSFALTPWLYHPASAGLALWPWVLFAVEYDDRPRRSFWLLLVLLVVWPLCGHLETVAVASLFTVLWLLLRAVGRDIERQRLARFALTGALALGLSMSVLLPQAHAIRASNRLVLARDPNHFAHVPWVPYRPGWVGGLLTTLFPREFGDAVDSPMIPGAAGSVVEMGFGYIGLVGWSLAFLTRTTAPHRAKQLTLLLLITLGFGGALGLGLFRNLFEAIPGLGLAPPLRLLLLVSITGATLAAFSMDRLLSGDGRLMARRLCLVSLVLAVVACLAYYRLRPLHQGVGGLASQRQALLSNLGVGILASIAAAAAHRRKLTSGKLTMLLTVLAGGQLMYEGMRLYRFYSPATLYPSTPLLEFLQSRPGTFRVLGADFGLFPNTNIFPSLEEVRTHDPIERRDYTQFLDVTCGYPPFEYAKRIRNLNAPALDFLNVRYLVTTASYAAPGPKWRTVYDGADGRVFENASVMPRFTVPPRVDLVRPTRGGPNALSRFGPMLDRFLTGDEYRQRALVLTEGIGLFPGHIEQNARESSLAVVAHSTNTITLDVITRDRSIVVGSVVQDGGWRATDGNGMKIPSSLANGPFLALVVPPGHHEIRLAYEPPGFRVGLFVTVLAGCVAVFVGIRRPDGSRETPAA